jgi:hypothetical protein
VHKTANILDKMPKSVQGRAKQLIHEMLTNRQHTPAEWNLQSRSN